MEEIIRIKFRGRGKSYSFAANGITARPGDMLVVETAKGMELGECVEGNRTVDDAALIQPLRPVLRAATADDAPIIILDEATANVDPENEKELTEAIENLTKEKTIIMIAHRLKTVRHADQIVVIDKGRIVQKGTHEDLMREEGIYKNFVSGRKKAVSWKIA